MLRNESQFPQPFEAKHVSELEKGDVFLLVDSGANRKMVICDGVSKKLDKSNWMVRYHEPLSEMSEILEVPSHQVFKVAIQ